MAIRASVLVLGVATCEAIISPRIDPTRLLDGHTEWDDLPYIDDPNFAIPNPQSFEDEEVDECVRNRSIAVRDIIEAADPLARSKLPIERESRLMDEVGPRCAEVISGPHNGRDTCAQPILGPIFYTGWRNRLLVVPKLKFAFCYIEKNACTQFNILMNRLNHLPEKKVPFFRSSYGSMNVSWEDITKKKGWRTAVFLRDPADRFLSAWRSKCVAWERNGVDCLGGQRAMGSSEEKVKKFEEALNKHFPTYLAYKEKLHGGGYNAHYDPQSGFCGSLNGRDFDFIGRLTGDTANVNEQVKHMLRSVAGASEDLIREAQVESIFPETRVSGHHATSPTNAEVYSNSETLSKVRKAFASDYTLLKQTSRMGLNASANDAAR